MHIDHFSESAVYLINSRNAIIHFTNATALKSAVEAMRLRVNRFLAILIELAQLDEDLNFSLVVLEGYDDIARSF